MADFENVDWFIDHEVHQDPYPYYEWLRAQGPAVYLPKHNVVAVVGYDEVMKVLRGEELYSAVNAVTGPFPPLPFTPEGDDITDQIEAHRSVISKGALLMTMDRPKHAAHRALLSGIITPKRLKENEAFIHRLAEKQVKAMLALGKFEAVTQFAHALAVLVVADLLGVPEGEHDKFLNYLPHTPPTLAGGEVDRSFNPLATLADALSALIMERRTTPREDVLTKLAQVTFPDGSTPDVADVANIGAFLFAAGQDTTVRLIGTLLRLLGDDPELMQLVRNDRTRIPVLVEEALRLESPSKVDFRLSKVHTKIGDIDVVPGTTVMMMLGAANRDPAKFENPNELNINRKNLHEHIAFGRGTHSCIGAPLARAEVIVALNKLLDHTSEIRINEAEHGPPGARRYIFPPRYTMRGPLALHVEVTAA